MRFKIVFNDEVINQHPQLKIKEQLETHSYINRLLGLRFEASNEHKAKNKKDYQLINIGVASTVFKYFKVVKC